MLETGSPTHNDDMAVVLENHGADIVLNDVNNKSINNIDDVDLTINNSETTIKSSKRSKKIVEKKKSVLEAKKNPTKKSTTPTKKKKNPKKKDDIAKKKSKGKKSVVEKSIGKKKYALKKKKTFEVEFMKEDVNNNSYDMLIPLNKKSKKIVGGKMFP